MALSEQAGRLKAAMSEAVIGRRELAAVEEEWRALVALWDDSEAEVVMASLPLARAVCRERRARRRTLVAAQLRAWARIGGCGALSPFQRRVLGLRYVQGRSWNEVAAAVGYTKQYVLREHGKGLERMVAAETAKLGGSDTNVGELDTHMGRSDTNSGGLDTNVGELDWEQGRGGEEGCGDGRA